MTPERDFIALFRYTSAVAIDFDKYRLQLGHCGRVRCEPQWRLDRQWSAALTDFDLWLVWDGRGTMRIDDEVVPLRRGVCLWMRPGRTYMAEQDPEARLGVSFAHFDLVRNGRRISSRLLPPLVHRVDDVTWFDLAMQRIVQVHKGGGAMGMVGRTILESLLGELTALAAAPSTTAHSPTRQAMLQVAMRIRENPSGRWSIPELATEAGYGVDHFTRLFASVCGSTPRRFVVSCRVERAQQLLRQTGLSVKEIARASGYRSVQFFCRQFSQFTGVSPSLWRTAGRD